MSFDNGTNNNKYMMNDELNGKNTRFVDIINPNNHSKEIKLSNKENKNDENSNINKNLKKEKHILIEKNIHEKSINFVNKKEDSFISKSLTNLKNTKEPVFKYNKEGEKKKKIDENKLNNSKMKDSKKKEDIDYKNNHITNSDSCNKDNKNFHKSYEKQDNKISIAPLNKKYIKYYEKKNKRSYEELSDRPSDEYHHYYDKKSCERYYKVSKKSYERKRHKNSPDRYDRRKSRRKIEKKVEISFKQSYDKQSKKKERLSNSEDSEYFSKKEKKKKSDLNYKELKLSDKKYNKNKEKYNKGNFECNETILYENKKSSSKTSDKSYQSYTFDYKTKNYKNIKVDEKMSSKNHIQKHTVNKSIDENKNCNKEKRKKEEVSYDKTDKKCIENEQKNVEDSYGPSKNNKDCEKYRNDEEIKEKNIKIKNLVKENNLLKRKIENRNENDKENRDEHINENVDKKINKNVNENINENIDENLSDNTNEGVNESICSSIDGKDIEKNKNENSSISDSLEEECETPNYYSSDSEKNKVDCILHGCRSVKNYRKLNKISEGTYGTVFRAQNKKTKKIVALKQLKHFSSIRNEGFAITSLREINILLQLKHENILSIKEVVIGNHLNDIYLVMEYIEHELKILLDNKSPCFTISELKCLLKQLLSGINYLHTNWVMHRDLKPTNLLYSNKGVLKICDFGMSRKFGHVTSHNLTKNVVTLWYRAPELLLGERSYTNKIDIWSAGCIFAEMILKKPLFIGDNEYEQIMKILSFLGLPDKESYPEFYEYSFISKNKDLFKKKKIKMNVNNIRSYFPNVANQFSGLYLSDNGLDLLKKLLHFNPKNRISAAEALNHPYFKEFPKPTEISEMPIIPDTNKIIRSNKMSHHFNLLNQKNIKFHS